MKTSIILKGQMASMNSITNALPISSYRIERHPSYQEIRFETKKEAINALSMAYQRLHSDIEDWNTSDGYYRRADKLRYDAAEATLTVHFYSGVKKHSIPLASLKK